MRRTLGLVLSAVGAFLLVAAVLLQTWVASTAMRTPIDADSTTNLDGEATFTNAEGSETVDVLAYSVNRADSERSSDDVVVFQSSSCMVKNEGDIDGCVSAEDPDERLISASTDAFATDRRTAVAVNDPAYSEPGAVEHTGLVNKWPFEAEETTYPYWDGVVGEAVDAVYDRTEELNGLEVYVYKVTVTGAPIEITDGVDGTYNDDKEIYIEPRTGAIVHQTEQQERLDTSGEPVIAFSIGFTDEQVDASVEEAKANASRLQLFTGTLPIVGYVVGIPLLLGGLFLSFLAFRNNRPDNSAT